MTTPFQALCARSPNDATILAAAHIASSTGGQFGSGFDGDPVGGDDWPLAA